MVSQRVQQSYFLAQDLSFWLWCLTCSLTNIISRLAISLFSLLLSIWCTTSQLFSFRPMLSSIFVRCTRNFLPLPSGSVYSRYPFALIQGLPLKKGLLVPDLCLLRQLWEQYLPPPALSLESLHSNSEEQCLHLSVTAFLSDLVFMWVNIVKVLGRV